MYDVRFLEVIDCISRDDSLQWGVQIDSMSTKYLFLTEEDEIVSRCVYVYHDKSDGFVNPIPIAPDARYEIDTNYEVCIYNESNI